MSAEKTGRSLNTRYDLVFPNGDGTGMYQLRDGKTGITAYYHETSIVGCLDPKALETIDGKFLEQLVAIIPTKTEQIFPTPEGIASLTTSFRQDGSVSAIAETVIYQNSALLVC